MASAPSDSVVLHCREEGEGPPVLLLHGLGGDHTVWNTVVPRLAEHHRVLAPDLRGHGRSPDGPTSTYTFPELEADLLRLLDERHVPPAHLVGLSAGGFLALRFALDHPARLRSLTLVASAAYCDPHMRETVRHWEEVYADQGREALVRQLVKDLHYPDWVEAHMEYVDQLRAAFEERSFRATARWGRAVEEFDLRGRLSRLRLPTRMVQAMDDRVVDGTHGRFLRQSIPGSDLKLFRETGHLVPIERPAETAEAIASLIDAVEERARGGAPAR